MHPSIKIFCVFVLAIAVHLLDYQALSAVAGVLSICLLYYRADGFLRMLRRLRWILASLILIFAFNTPGEYVLHWPYELAPTYEGLYAGLMQAARLCIMLAGLSLLLATTNRENLMVGFFLLLYPLRYLKLSPERFAARLWLTLHYVDHASGAEPHKGLFDRLSTLKMNGDQNFGGPERIQLIAPEFTWRDWLTILGLVIAGVFLL